MLYGLESAILLVQVFAEKHALKRRWAMYNWANVMVHEEHLKDIRREVAHDQLAARARGKPTRRGNGLAAWALYLLLIGVYGIGKTLHV